MRAFAMDLEQGRHDQRAVQETAEERAANDQFARALQAAFEQPEVSALLPEEGVIYFIQRGDDGPIKIGFTTRDPHERLAQLQVGSPEPLRLLGYLPDGTLEEERALHGVFAEHRLSGEWFDPDDYIFEWIASHGA